MSILFAKFLKIFPAAQNSQKNGNYPSDSCREFKNQSKASGVCGMPTRFCAMYGSTVSRHFL